MTYHKFWKTKFCSRIVSELFHGTCDISQDCSNLLPEQNYVDKSMLSSVVQNFVCKNEFIGLVIDLFANNSIPKI